MSLPLEVKTQDSVLAAQVRNVLSNGGTWTDVAPLTNSSGGDATNPNTIEAVTDTASTASGIAKLTLKVNQLITLINNVNA